MTTAQTESPRRTVRPKPFLFPRFCKSCGRCIETCPKDCIELAAEIEPLTGLRPVVVDLDLCKACGLCFEACPEPYGLMPLPDPDFDPSTADPETFFGPPTTTGRGPAAIPDRRLELPRLEPLVLKGTHAAAIGALLAEGIRAGLFRPVSLWPFPVRALAPLLERTSGLVMVEAGPGQIEDEMRLALSHDGVAELPPVHRFQRYGGMLPQQRDIVDRVRHLAAASATGTAHPRDTSRPEVHRGPSDQVEVER